MCASAPDGVAIVNIKWLTPFRLHAEYQHEMGDPFLALLVLPSERRGEAFEKRNGRPRILTSVRRVEVRPPFLCKVCQGTGTIVCPACRGNKVVRARSFPLQRRKLPGSRHVLEFSRAPSNSGTSDCWMAERRSCLPGHRGEREVADDENEQAHDFVC
jgi:hypothetical protein